MTHPSAGHVSGVTGVPLAWGRYTARRLDLRELPIAVIQFLQGRPHLDFLLNERTPALLDQFKTPLWAQKQMAAGSVTRREQRKSAPGGSRLHSRVLPAGP